MVYMEMRSSYGRNVIQGITRYARSHRAWLLHIYSPPTHLRELLRRIRPRGLIAHLRTLKPAQPYARRGLSVVGIGSAASSSGYPRVANDEGALGQLAAEYFFQRGFRNFAFVDAVGPIIVKAREQAFHRALEALGPGETSYHLYRSPPPAVVGVDAGLRRWLKTMPMPLAVWTYDDLHGFAVLRACQAEELHVPEDVAVLGSGNDELLCEASFPPMSSIATPAERIGYEAAGILDRMLAGTAPADQPILLPPMGVVTRQSTDVLAIHDTNLAEALRYIRLHAHEGISVQDILEVVPITRRRLEQLFAAVLRRTPAAEIRRVRVEAAKELLAGTDVSMAEVARRSGFSDAIRLAEVFRRQTGQTPSSFRRQFRLA